MKAVYTYMHVIFLFVCFTFLLTLQEFQINFFFLYFDTGLLFVEFEVKINVINFGKSCKKCVIRYGTSEAP